MSFRYQKRINIGKGVGLNISKSGISTSYRTRHGSVGTRGFSFKTGIPGLSYRANWGKAGYGILVVFALAGIFILAYNLIRLLIYMIRWCYDRIVRSVQKQQQPKPHAEP